MNDILYNNLQVGRTANQIWALSGGLQYYDETNKLYYKNCNIPESIKTLFPTLVFHNYNNEKVAHSIGGYCQEYNKTKEEKLQKYCKFPDKIVCKYNRWKRYKRNLTVIHVRRGDYLQNGNENLYYTLTPEYIKDTVNKYKFNKDIVVISDDIEWCRKNLTFLPSDTHYSNGTIYEDLYLLTIAKNIICSGSSLSIIGCVLNKNKDKLCIGIKPYWQGTPDWMFIYPDYFKLENYLPYIKK